MKIAIDIDGVLLDLMVTFCELFNQKYNTNNDKKDVSHWEFFYDWNITEKDAYDIFNEIYKDSTSVPFIDKDSPHMMRELNEIHHVDILSARDPKYKVQLIKKLEMHDIKKTIQYRHLILIDNKPYDLKLQHDYDIYVDDNPNLVENIKKMDHKLLILYDQPWNQHCFCDDNVIRVHDWKEVHETLKFLDKN